MDISTLDQGESTENAIETLRKIAEIFGNNRMIFEGPNAEYAAQQIAFKQKEFATNLFSVVFSDLKNQRPGDRNLASFVSNYINRIFNQPKHHFGPFENGYEIKSTYAPIIDDKLIADAKRLLKAHAGIDEAEVRDLFVAGYLRATRLANDQDVLNQLGLSTTNIVAAIAKFEALWTIDAAREANEAHGVSENEAAADNLRMVYSSTAVAVEGALAKLVEQTREATETTSLVQERVAGLETMVQNALSATANAVASAEQDISKAKSGVTDALAAIRAEANFEDLKIHWINRGKNAQTAFWVSSVFLLLLLIVVPGVAIWQNEMVFSFMAKLVGAATVDVGDNPGPVTITVATISRLVIITIPLALYFWLIRLIVRFNMRSMLLMDDARQRATMLETYYRMIERSAATTEDRALVLQALMRPPPGHGPDTVEPPNFTEVIATLGKK